MRRRNFLQALGGTTALAFVGVQGGTVRAQAQDRPNILWISTEDMSPDMGCYGDPYAITPNLDRFATRSVRYTRALGHMGVCAPVRSGIITAMHPTTIGTNHMRCSGVPQPEVKCFPEYLRAAGYWCTNRSKTDYQFDPPFTAWDENSASTQDWDDRAEGQPFFCVINFTNTHESQIRSRGRNDYDQLGADKHDPAKAIVAPYHPDTPIVRHDYAQYADNITLMDRMAQEVLDKLEADGLADNTIVFFWGDHGRGLPRCKRWIYDSGIQFPLIIHVPEKWRAHAKAGEPGSVNGDLVGFLDLGPTVLSLAGVEVPKHVHGRPFLGPQKAQPREYIFSARDRIDEAYDIMRAVRDKKYHYLRNLMHHLTYALDVEYMNEMPTMQEMRRLNAEGKLAAPASNFFLQPRPVEELYDVEADPYEVNNLAGKPEYADIVAKMRDLLYNWMIETGDFGLIPEAEFDAMKWPGGQGQAEKTKDPVLSKGEGGRVVLSCQTPGASIGYSLGERWQVYAAPIEVPAGKTLQVKACRIGFKDSETVTWKSGDPLADAPATPKADHVHWREQVDSTDLIKRLVELKKNDGKGKAALPAYHAALGDPAGSVRYWAAVGLRVECKDADDIAKAQAALEKHVADPSPVVRIAAAQALRQWGGGEDLLGVLTAELEHPLDSVRLHAMTAISQLGKAALPVIDRVRTVQKSDKTAYVKNVATQALRAMEA